MLNRLLENAKHTGPEDLNWIAAPLNELTRHSREKHHGCVREAIPRTRALSDKVASRHGANHTELADRSWARDEYAYAQGKAHSLSAKEHDAAGDLVRQIRILSAQYTPPRDACTSFKALYEALREFEADIHQHVHLENNVLFPRAMALEASAHRNG